MLAKYAHFLHFAGNNKKATYNYRPEDACLLTEYFYFSFFSLLPQLYAKRAVMRFKYMVVSLLTFV